jgi:hypothetical protein
LVGVPSESNPVCHPIHSHPFALLSRKACCASSRSCATFTISVPSLNVPKSTRTRSPSDVVSRTMPPSGTAGWDQRAESVPRSGVACLVACSKMPAGVATSSRGRSLSRLGPSTSDSSQL